MRVITGYCSVISSKNYFLKLLLTVVVVVGVVLGLTLGLTEGVVPGLALGEGVPLPPPPL